MDLATLDFHLPPELEAAEPPEVRGLARDAVRLLVSHRASDGIEHARFRDLPHYLSPGDVVVVNASATLPAALAVTRVDGTPLELHLSTHLPGGLWSVELRRPDQAGTKPFYEAGVGEVLRLPEGASATLHAPYRRGEGSDLHRPARLWLATLDLLVPVEAYLARAGFPIRYGYVRHYWPIEYYQTVYATESGSAEMPSAGRAFTPEVLACLDAHGVHVVSLILHAGVASLEDREPPYEEYYRVPAATAEAVNGARAAGHRVVAVGTTVVRALETTVDERGLVHPCSGWTGLVVTPERGVRAVDALLTGLHEPRASHLGMLAALAGPERLRAAYEEALKQGYLWHEFGDLHLIL